MLRFLTKTSAFDAPGKVLTQRFSYRLSSARTAPPQSPFPIPEAHVTSKASAKVPAWVPGRGLLKYSAVAWLVENSLLICGYQFIMEGTLTAVFAWLLHSERMDPNRLQSFLSDSLRYPFHWLYTPADGIYEEPMRCGPVGSVSARTMTALHCGHNAAASFLPVQVLIIVTTFPFYKRGWTSLKSRFIHNKTVQQLTKPPDVPEYMAKWSHGGSGAAAPTGTAPQPASKSSVKTSYSNLRRAQTGATSTMRHATKPAPNAPQPRGAKPTSTTQQPRQR